MKTLAAIYLLKKKGKVSHKVIAEVMGGIQTKSISPALKRVEKLIINNEDFSCQIALISECIDKMIGAST